MLKPMAILTVLFAGAVGGAGGVGLGGDVGWEEVTVMVFSGWGGVLLVFVVLEVRFGDFGKRSKSRLMVELDAGGGCWMQASFRACKSGEDEG